MRQVSARATPAASPHGTVTAPALEGAQKVFGLTSSDGDERRRVPSVGAGYIADGEVENGKRYHSQRAAVSYKSLLATSRGYDSGANDSRAHWAARFLISASRTGSSSISLMVLARAFADSLTGPRPVNPST